MEMLVILDFGGSQSRSVARRVRGEHVYCEILPAEASLAHIMEKKPKGILLVGGEEKEGPLCVGGAAFEAGVPVLAMGPAARAALSLFGGGTGSRALEHCPAHIVFADDRLFTGLTECDRFIETADELVLPEGFAPVAETQEGLCAAYACPEKSIYGMQFYPEHNDPDGSCIIANFACDLCGCQRVWSIETFLEEQVQAIRAQVGDGHALIALSGGVDSAVCALLMHRAIGLNVHCVHVDNGFMRSSEAGIIAEVFGRQLGMDLHLVNAEQRFLSRLTGIKNPGEKRRVIYEEFQKIFEEEAAKLGQTGYLVRGTIYTDVLSNDVSDISAGIPFAGLLEPLRCLFKEEVRDLGALLGLPQEMIRRQPFPGSGFAIRCLGEVTGERLDILRKADAIFCEEILRAGLDKKIRQYFAVLSEAYAGQSVTVVLRAVNAGEMDSASAVRLPYDLLETCVERIMTEVKGVDRVVYDITGKPYAPIEWE